MKKQVIVIHGGDSFNTYEQYLKFLRDWKINFESYCLGKKDWKATLGERLGPDFEVIQPNMPNKQNAKYLEWKIWFEKFIPFLEPEVTLIGHSLGGLFLAKYLFENKFPRKIKGVFLVAAVYDYEDEHSYLADFTLPKELSLFEKQANKIFLYHSKDDNVVPFADFEKYQNELKGAVVRAFQDRGHFNQEELPEIVKDIKSLY
ncbi:hypothetical protein C4553_00995 [Candidatus Parcubacteria bacterium]|nr:MAG: hypothetical protein C4553_00995 [Candidatus Parcubacteria bacterium]